MGPLYGFALMFEGSHEAVPPDSPGAVRIEGLILDGDGAPLAWPEGFIEIWQGEQFARGRTDEAGRYSVVVRKPAAEPTPEGPVLAPYFNVAVFARGLLKQVVTRVYFPDEAAANATPEATRRKVGWVKEAAGARFDDIELNTLIGFAVVTDDRQSIVDAMAPALGIDPGDALHIPLALIGTLEEMAEELEWRRREYGISYFSVESDAWESLVPVVARLAGN